MKELLWPNSRNKLIIYIFSLLCIHLILWEGDYENVLALIVTAFLLTIGQKIILLGSKGQNPFVDSYFYTLYFLCLAFLIIALIVFIGDTFFIKEKPPMNGIQRIY